MANLSECLQHTVYEQICRLNSIWNCSVISMAGRTLSLCLFKQLSMLTALLSHEKKIRHQLKFSDNESFFLHHAAGHSVSPLSWCCWTCCPLFPGSGATLSLYCCSCWAWDLFSWQWFGCWHLFASWHRYIFWLLSRFLWVFHKSSLLFPHVLFHPPYAFTYSVTFSSYPFLLPFSWTSFVLLSLKNLYKHHRSKTTIQEKDDPWCPQFREAM